MQYEYSIFPIYSVSLPIQFQGYDYGRYEDLYKNYSLPVASADASNSLATTTNSTLASNATTAADCVAYANATTAAAANATICDPLSESDITTPGPGYVEAVEEPHLNELDTAFVWLRYMHCVLAPILIYAIHKDIRKKTKELLCCWRPNSVESASPRPVSMYLRRQRKELEKQKKKFKNITNYK
jgi:hypothetical protein